MDEDYSWDYDPCEDCEETDYWECANCVLIYGDDEDYDPLDI